MSVDTQQLPPLPLAKRARESKPRWTDKRIAQLRDDTFKAGYDSGHIDGWRECQEIDRTPLVDFLAGFACGGATVGSLLLWLL